jgi:hypothetical protein
MVSEVSAPCLAVKGAFGSLAGSYPDATPFDIVLEL